MSALPRSRFPLAIFAVLLCGLGTWGIILMTRSKSSEPPTEPTTSKNEVLEPARLSDTPSGKSPAPSAPRPRSENDEFQKRIAGLQAIADAEVARSRINELRTYLSSLDPALATSLVRSYLESGEDANLPLDFKIGNNGFLDVPPTLRVGLLDILGQLDPVEGARLGREILESPTAPDEWAISLRNVARIENDEPANHYLRQKTEELIRNQEWQANPSVGYLNAFDVLVHTRAIESTPLLSELIQRKDRRDLAHAGFLTLDRLTQRAPASMLRRLQQDRALQQSRPEMVAQQFARADLRDPTQNALVRSWLLDPARTQSELQSFAGVFPNNNQMISRNLLTAEERISGAALLEHDREALAIVSQWQQEQEFQNILPHLDTMTHRLASFVRQSSGPERSD